MNEKQSSAAYLPWPDEWVESYRHFVGTLRKLALSTVAVIAVTAVLFAADLSLVAIAAAFIPMLLSGAIVGAAVILPSRRRSGSALRGTGVGTPSTYVPYVRAHKIGRVALVLSIALLLASPSVAVVMWSAREDFRFAVLRLVAILMVVGTVAMVLYAIGYLVFGRALGIALTSTGIRNHTDLVRGFYPWDEIEKITPRSHGAFVIELVGNCQPDETGRARQMLEKLAPYKTKPSEIPAAYLAINPASAFHALRYYHRHPERRAELGTDAAIERIRAGSFDD